MKLTKKFYCVVNGWDCPYWKKDGSCSMVDDGDDPVFECDEAGYFWDGEAEENEYFIWEDEDGKRYDVQELLEKGYYFVNGEPVLPFDEFYKSKFIKSWQPGEPLRVEDFLEE